MVRLDQPHRAWFPCPQLVHRGPASRGLQGHGFLPATAGSGRGLASPRQVEPSPSPSWSVSATPGPRTCHKRWFCPCSVGRDASFFCLTSRPGPRFSLLFRCRETALLLPRCVSPSVLHYKSLPAPHQGPSTGLCRLRTAQPHLVARRSSLYCIVSSLRHLEAIWESRGSVTPDAILNQGNFDFHD